MSEPVKKKNAWQKLDPARKRRILIAGGAVLAVVLLVWIVDVFTHEETDDAYVSGHIHYVSSRISGVVQEVDVDDNQVVKEGQVLVKLDPRDYQAAQLETQSDQQRAQLDFERAKDLLSSDAGSKEDYQHAQSALAVATARLTLADLQVSYATITAPAGGRVGRKNVEVGTRVQAGQTLLAIVEPDLWVVANFKETQLAHMRAGQKVSMTVDAIPGHTFTGVVDSFSPASGNEFALLPADNSTGNFTKIVQRVPVKIRFDQKTTQGYEDRLRAGLSVVVKVRI